MKTSSPPNAEKQCRDRLDCLRRRVHFLEHRIASRPGMESGYDREEVNAIKWAIAAAERVATLEQLLRSLRHGSCWCRVATGNPMVRDHTSACKAIQELLG